MRILQIDSVSIKPGFYLYTALLLLALPLRWVFGWLTAVAFHELCHCLVLRLLDIRIYALTIQVSGFRLYTQEMGIKQELLTAIAGPVGGFILCLVGRKLPCTAICSFFLSIYNMLPIYPLDGGRVVRCLVKKANWNPRWIKVFVVVRNVLLCALSAVIAVASVVYRLGLIGVLLCVFLLIKSNCLKIPCKAD